MNKGEIRVIADRCQGLQIAGIGELVENNHGAKLLSNPVKNKVASDEAGSPCDDDAIFHACAGPHCGADVSVCAFPV